MTRKVLGDALGGAAAARGRRHVRYGILNARVLRYRTVSQTFMLNRTSIE